MNGGLAELEREFYAYLRGGPAEPVAARVAERGPASTAVRLGIYANAYSKRLTEALEADHEMLGHYLGDALWERMCSDYIAARPSRFRSLRQFGDALPGFLAAHEAFSQHPVVAELAAFERALLDAFDAADADRAAWADLLALPQAAWPGLRLGFHPSVRRLAAEWNGVPIWQALKAGREPPPATPTPGAAWLLWRDESRITQFRALAADENAALAAMLEAGADFAALCERLAEQHAAEQVPAQALELLQGWFDTGLVSTVEGAAPAARSGPAPIQTRP